MKIVFVFGKGIDGCGVTKGALLFEEWLVESGHSTSIIDFDNKQVMLRAKNTKFLGPVYKVPSIAEEVSKDILNEANSADIIIFHSYPTRKQFAYVERFRKFVEKVSGPIIVMHDHGVSQQTINLPPQAGELFCYADVLVPQSLNGISATAFTKFDQGLTGRIIENPIWFKPKTTSKFYQPYNQRLKNFMYVGRTSVIKDPSMLCRVEKYFPEGWQFSLVGCEKSISMFRPKSKMGEKIDPSPYISEYKDKILYYILNKSGEYILSNWGHGKEGESRIIIYDNYQYEWGMEQLGKSIASWCGYKLRDSSNYGKRMEYTMIESFLLTLPVINRHFAENAMSPEGKLWKDYDGPIISQAGEEEQLADELIRITGNKSEWEDRSIACQELIHKFNDISILAPTFLNQILTLGKRTDKTNPLKAFENWFPNAEELRNKGEILMSNPTSILSETPMVLVGNKQKVVVR